MTTESSSATDMPAGPEIMTGYGQEETPDQEPQESGPEQSEEETDEHGEEVVEAAAQPEAKPAKGVQKRIDELTGNWRAEQRRADQLQQMLDRATAGQKQESESHAKPTQSNDAPPKIEDFDFDHDEFQRALVRHEAKQMLREEREKEQQERARSEEAEFIRGVQAKANAAMEKYPDFREKVIENESLPIFGHVLDFVTHSDVGADIAYFLAHNLEKAHEIAKMNPMRAGYELVAIESKLKSPPAKTTTKAPDPVRPVGNGGSRAEPDSDQEWFNREKAKFNRR